MDINLLREQLYSKYPGKAWKKKVDKMSDSQIFAIVKSIEEREKRENKNKLQPKLFDDP